jgi:hypothetical protein
MVDFLEQIKTELLAAGSASGAALITWWRMRKKDNAEIDNLVVESIKSLMKDHNNLYERVVVELTELREEKRNLEEKYREEIIRGIERDKIIANLEIKIATLEAKLGIKK